MPPSGSVLGSVTLPPSGSVLGSVTLPPLGSVLVFPPSVFSSVDSEPFEVSVEEASPTVVSVSVAYERTQTVKATISVKNKILQSFFICFFTSLFSYEFTKSISFKK